MKTPIHQKPYPFIPLKLTHSMNSGETTWTKSSPRLRLFCPVHLQWVRPRSRSFWLWASSGTLCYSQGEEILHHIPKISPSVLYVSGTYLAIDSFPHLCASCWYNIWYNSNNRKNIYFFHGFMIGKVDCMTTDLIQRFHRNLHESFGLIVSLGLNKVRSCGYIQKMEAPSSELK